MTDWKRLYEATLVERKMLNSRMAQAADYDKALGRLELSPNGDDYNAILAILRGQAYSMPVDEGR